MEKTVRITAGRYLAAQNQKTPEFGLFKPFSEVPSSGAYRYIEKSKKWKDAVSYRFMRVY